METNAQREFSFTNEGYIDRAIHLQDLERGKFEAYGVFFARPVTIQRCSFSEFEIQGGAFSRGLDILNSNFEGPFTMFASGHNMYGTPIRFRNCTFQSFADFGDSWFEGPFELSKCEFRKGSNLAGNLGTPIEVTFDSKPQYEQVEGKLNIDTYEIQNH